MTALLIIAGVILYSVLYIGGIFMLLFNYQTQIFNEANDKTEYEQNKEAFALCSAQFETVAEIKECMSAINSDSAPMTNPIDGQQFAGFFSQGLRVTRDVLVGGLTGKYVPNDSDWETYQKDAEKKQQELLAQQNNVKNDDTKNLTKAAGWAVAAIVTLKIIFK